MGLLKLCLGPGCRYPQTRPGKYSMEVDWLGHYKRLRVKGLGALPVSPTLSRAREFLQRSSTYAAQSRQHNNHTVTAFFSGKTTHLPKCLSPIFGFYVIQKVICKI